MTNREHATKGFKVLTGTSAQASNFYGITVLADAIVASLTAPTGNPPDQVTAYSCDTAGIAGPTLPQGMYLPIRGSSITLTSGKVILWLE